jgi:hypothetical protein
MKSLSIKEGSKTSLESFVVHFNNIKLSATSHMSLFTLLWHHMCRKHAQFFYKSTLQIESLKFAKDIQPKSSSRFKNRPR